MSVFIASFISLLIIVDPPGSAAIFSVLTKDKTVVQKKVSALHSALIATGILVIAAFFGQQLLNLMNISLDIVRVIGGSLLIITAYKMVFDDGAKKALPRNVALYPMGTHLLAGPGCISVVILSMDKITTSYDSFFVILAILAVQAIALFSMLLASQILSMFGGLIVKRMSQFMGVILGCLAVFMLTSGLQGFFIS